MISHVHNLDLCVRAAPIFREKSHLCVHPHLLFFCALQRQNATVDEIRSAFRRELMLYHPDRAEAEGIDPQQATQRTRELYDAYAVLRDPSKRAEYDRSSWRRS